MKKILRIGEFSQINQISIQTLRFYDQIGLLKPYKVDPETNYRYYHINQSSLVDSIQYLRQLNFSLEDIKEILSDKDHFQLHQLIEERYQRLLEEKENLEKQIQEIEIFRSGARIYGEKQSEQELEIHKRSPSLAFRGSTVSKTLFRLARQMLRPSITPADRTLS